MRKPSLFFILVFTTLCLGVWLIFPKIPSKGAEKTALDQAIIFYLSMKDHNIFDFAEYRHTIDSWGLFSKNSEEKELLLQFLAFQEGKKISFPGSINLPQWELLRSLKAPPDQGSSKPMSLDALNRDSWLDMALLKAFYRHKGLAREEAQAAINLSFCEGNLRKKSKVASWIELISILGLALLIQNLFPWKLAKAKWLSIMVEPVGVSLNQLSAFLVAFFLLYMVSQIGIGYAGTGIIPVFMGYLVAVFLAWILLRLILFKDKEKLYIASGLKNLHMSPSVIIFAAFGFCVLVFFSHITGFLLNQILWPFQEDAATAYYSDLLNSPSGSTLFIVLTCLIAPVCEEVLFRGILLRSLANSMSKWEALLWSSLVFAVFHPLTLLPLIFVLGLSLGLVFVRTKNIMASILTHMLWNAFMIFQLKLGV